MTSASDGVASHPALRRHGTTSTSVSDTHIEDDALWFTGRPSTFRIRSKPDILIVQISALLIPVSTAPCMCRVLRQDRLFDCECG